MVFVLLCAFDVFQNVGMRHYFGIAVLIIDGVVEWLKSGHSARVVNKIDLFGRYLSWCSVVISSATHLGDVVLILLYLLKRFPCLCAKYKCVN